LGIHPLFTGDADDTDLDRLDQALTDAAQDPALVAVGEIGLDGWVPGLDWTRQRRFYEAQLKLARKHDLPVILHVRRSADALLQALRRIEVPGGIAHAFNGSRQQADAFIGLGFALGFGGAMTFDQAHRIRRLAVGLPPEALVLETDAPDIPPRWIYRTAAERAAGATSRNEPAELPRIGAELAALRGWGPEETAAVTRANAHRVLPRLRPAAKAAPA
jgi:TatD DNase family protein